MSESKAGLRESLELAIYREIGARDVYSAIAGKIVNPEGRERFMRLSSDEEGHRAKLVAWRERLFGGAFVTDPAKLRETLSRISTRTVTSFRLFVMEDIVVVMR